MSESLTTAQAQEIDHLMPGNNLYRVGTLLKYCLDQIGGTDTDGINIVADIVTGVAIAGTMTNAVLCSGTATNGLSMTGTITNGISLAGTQTTGIVMTGAKTTGMRITATSLTDAILINATTPVDGIEISSACSGNSINLTGASAKQINMSAGTIGIDMSGATGMLNNIILGGAGRISTGSAAGSTLNIDATTSLYAEGLELRYNISDWADGAVTLSAGKGMYLRMETNEANGAGSITGAEIYGATNNVDIQYITGALVYAYAKGVSAKTITGMYAFQPELSFDAGSAANTIAEACVVRAKVTGGVMSDYTALHGYKLIVGDMDGGSRVYGNAFWVVDDAAMAGTCSFTNGLYINIGCTNDIKLQSGSTISDANHLDIETLADDKRIRLNDRNYAVTSGDIIGFSAKPAANATGTQTVYGAQISPRANDNVDVACLVGAMVEPILKGATGLAVSGDLRGLDVRLTSEGANNVGGIAGNIFCYNLLKSATFTGGVYPIVVKASGDTQPWTGLMEIPTGVTNVANGSGTDVYINITINGVAARIAAKFVS